MFSSVLAPLERLFALSRAQASPTSAKLGPAEDGQGENTTKKEYIDHLQIPPARKEVQLTDLLQVSRRKGAAGDFEVIPRTKGVLVMEDANENVERGDEAEDWQHLGCDGDVDDGRVSYAQVTGVARRVS